MPATSPIPATSSTTCPPRHLLPATPPSHPSHVRHVATCPPRHTSHARHHIICPPRHPAHARHATTCRHVMHHMPATPPVARSGMHHHSRHVTTCPPRHPPHAGHVNNHIPAMSPLACHVIQCEAAGLFPAIVALMCCWAYVVGLDTVLGETASEVACYWVEWRP